MGLKKIFKGQEWFYLTKGKNCTKNLSQAVNFKPVSLHEILSNRDKQEINSERPRRATSLTRPIFDEKRMKHERGARQSMTGLRTWLCYVEIILASTAIEKFFCPFFSRHDHALIPVEDHRPNIEARPSFCPKQFQGIYKNSILLIA
jgi:hypothetical protein